MLRVNNFIKYAFSSANDVLPVKFNYKKAQERFYYTFLNFTVNKVNSRTVIGSLIEPCGKLAGWGGGDTNQLTSLGPCILQHTITTHPFPSLL